EAAQGDVELGDGAAVQLGGGDDVVARPGERREGDELGAHPGCGRDRADPALERGDPLLGAGERGVADGGVDIAVLLQREQVPGVVRVIEHERGGLVDRDGARAVLGVRRAARVQRTGAEAEPTSGCSGRSGRRRSGRWGGRGGHGVLLEVLGHADTAAFAGWSSGRVSKVARSASSAETPGTTGSRSVFSSVPFARARSFSFSRTIGSTSRPKAAISSWKWR